MPLDPVTDRTSLVPDAQRVANELKLGEIVGEEALHGGFTSTVRRLRFSGGRSLVYKESVNAKPAMYECEADGLRTLADAGFRTPEVFSFGEDHLLIEDLGAQAEPTPEDWITFAQALGRLHNVTNSQFGYHRPNYLGTMLMTNNWREDGHGFFTETRLLFFLSKPNIEALLDAEDRRRVERVARRICDEVPAQPACLTHGDLWTGNMLWANGVPALIDPAVHYNWAEADLALLPWFPQITDDFYRAYEEVHPLEAGWRDRLELLSVRDPICMVAEYGDTHDSVARLRGILAKLA